MKRIIPILILLASAVAAGVYLYPRLVKKPAPANQLTLSGNIEAHQSLVGFKVSGRIVELPVEEGQQVAQGALLARLDSADYKQRVSVDEATVRVRESNLALMLAGTRHQEVKAAQQTMIDAEADLDEKKIDNERAQNLFAKDEVSAQERDLAATALK
ncbi:MAG: biotin/lipoyl-binding protein, partial [Terracidiphilus sp.]